MMVLVVNGAPETPEPAWKHATSASNLSEAAKAGPESTRIQEPRMENSVVELDIFESSQRHMELMMHSYVRRRIGL